MQNANFELGANDKMNTPPTAKSFSMKVGTILADRDWTIYKLANEVNEAFPEIAISTIKGCCNGTNFPSGKSMYAIAKILDTSLDYLLGLSNNKYRTTEHEAPPKVIASNIIEMIKKEYNLEMIIEFNNSKDLYIKYASNLDEGYIFTGKEYDYIKKIFSMDFHDLEHLNDMIKSYLGRLQIKKLGRNAQLWFVYILSYYSKCQIIDE